MSSFQSGNNELPPFSGQLASLLSEKNALGLDFRRGGVLDGKKGLMYTEEKLFFPQKYLVFREKL